MKRTKGKATMKAAVESMAPIAKALRELERCSRGVMAQYDGIPSRHEGAEKPLDKVQRGIDSAFESFVGRKLRAETFADPQLIRDVLRAIERLADLSGAKIETAGLPLSVGVWTDDPFIYAPLDRDDPARERADSKFRLVDGIRIDPLDGSLLRRPRR